ncbi:hypothetical protein Tco_1532766 [Tanacetum coccineum]
MTFGGNTHDLGSFGEETDEITDLHQIHEEILFSKREDDVTGIKGRRHDPSSDGVRDLVTASGRGRLNDDLESSTYGYSSVGDINRPQTTIKPHVWIILDEGGDYLHSNTASPALANSQPKGVEVIITQNLGVSPLGEELSLFDRPNKVERGRILEAHRLESILQQQISQRMALSHHDVVFDEDKAWMS